MHRQRDQLARRRQRRLLTEALEPRLLLANDLPFQNPGQQFDVNRDLRISALDALQVINFVGRNGPDFVLPEINESVRFPDVNGNKSVSSLDALQVINRLSPLAPILAARLVSDSAPGGQQNLDFITNQFSLEFGVTHGDGSEQLEVRIDGSGDDPFVASGVFSGDDPLMLDEAALNSIAGGPLSDGDHQFDVRIAGEEPVGSFVVTVDKAAPESPSDVQLSPESDSGISDSDGVTTVQSPDVQGDAETGSVVTLLIDGVEVGQTTATSPWQISAGTLDEGEHSATAITEDIAGNPSDVSAPLQIVIDLTAPDEPTFELDPSFDSPPPGDAITHIGKVTVVGQTTADVQVELLELGEFTTSDSEGAFQFDDVALSLGANLLTARATDMAGNEREFSTTITVQNEPPQFDPVGPLSVMPGDRLEVQLSATDLDGDSVTFSIDSAGQLPSGSFASGILAFHPTPDDVGTYEFTLTASDGFELTPQQVTLNVLEDPVTSTRISGRILDTNSLALEGVRVAIGDTEGFTAADGAFQLDFGRSALPGDTLRVHANELAGTETYPFIAEKLPLLFGGREVIGGVNNVISRPIFLPALDMANAVTIDPSQNMTVTTPLIPGIQLSIAAGSLLDQQGNPFTGELSITAVPPDLTPAALPEGSSPDLVVTIQPGDMVFTQPAPLDFPNTGGWAPGLMMNIMSINPVTGEFDDVGDAVVSADGTMIETISGGVRNSSWHFPEPPPPPPHFPPDEPDCEDCELDFPVGSEVSASTGALSETHDLVSYQSLGQSRALTLTYDSLRADPRPIFHFDYDDVDPARIFSDPESLQVVARASVNVDGVEIVADGFDNPGEFGLRGGENFFSIPAGSGPLDGALQIDLTDEPTGIYAKKMQVGLRGFTGTRFIGSSTVLGDEFLHVNTINSPFGSGWGIDGLQEIVEGPDGSVAIIDGDGSALRWEPGVRQIQDFLAANQGNESVQRFDGMTGALRGEFVMPGAGGLNNPHNPTFGTDGDLYVVSDSGGPTAQILRYDGNTGEFLDVFVDTNEGGFVGAAEQAFAPDGSLYLATVSNLGVLGFDRFGNFIDSIAGPADGVQQACGIEFGPDGLLYVWDTSDEEMRRFDPTTGDLVDVFIPAGNMSNACDFDFGPDGDIFITDLTFNQIRRFSGVDGSFLGVFADTNPGVSGITFGPDGNFYANVAGNTHRFNGQTGEFIDEFVSGLGGFNNFFPPPPADIQSEYLNPRGDFSTLEKLPDGRFQRTLPDQTVFTFNDQNKLESIVDRNGNQTLYAYDAGGDIRSITDPVGLVTTFTYDNGRVSTITDPAARQTILEYDVNGNLTRITDPDASSRSFQYDERHLMSGETDKRGNQEFDFFDDFGRLTSSMLADGTEIQITPRHVRGLFPAELTADPNTAPAAARGFVDSEYIDGNGNALITTMDAIGQRVSARDDVGPLPTIQRDPDTNLVTSTTDARGNETQFTYDDFGNLTSVMDSIHSGRLGLVGRLPIENFPATLGGIDAIRGVTIRGDQAYVFGDGGVHTVDISEPSNPAHLGVDFVDGSDFGLVDGDRLMVVSAGSTVSGFSDLRYFDLTGDGSPQDPAPRGSLPAAFVLGDDIVVNGDNAFVSYRQFRRMGENDIFEQNGTVIAYNLSDGDNLARADLLFNDNGATNEAPVVSMGGDFLVGGLAAVNSTTLYVGSTTATGTDTQTGEGSLLVVNVSDPTQLGPTAIDNVLPLPGTTLISDIVVVESVAYVLGSEGGLRDNSPDSSDFGPTGNLALSSIDIADPNNPALIRTQVLDRAARGGFNDNGLNLTQIGPDLFAITSLGALDDVPQLITIDVSDPNAFLIDQRIDLAGTPQGLATDGSFVYVTTSDGLQVYEVRSPDSLGSPPLFTYDPVFNQQTSRRDELGRQTLFEIDPANGNRLSTTQVIGDVGGDDDVVTQFTYTAAGLTDTITDPLSRITDFDYDSLGRLTTITFALGTADEVTQQFEYDAAGNQTVVMDENGNRTEYEYDAMNRVTRIIEADPDGPGTLVPPVTVFTYDAAGNVVSADDPQNVTTTFQYDARDRLAAEIDSQGNETLFQYDGVGNLVSRVDANANRMQFTYDARNRLDQEIDPAGGTTTFEYDLVDNVTAVTDPETNRTTFAYDSRDRIIRQTDPIGNELTFVYDAVDNLISKTDRNGRLTEFTYDDLNRLAAEMWVGDGNVLQYAYDAASNLTSVIDDFSSTSFTYDNRNRLKTADNSGTPNVPNVILTYTYDGVGNVTSLAETIAELAGGTNSYQYDGLNRLAQLEQTGTDISDKRVDFTYNQIGQFETITRFSELAGTEEVVTSSYVYDSLNRLQSLSHDHTSSTVAFFDHVYDAAGRLTQITDLDGITNYSYDSRDQLTAASHDDAGNPDESYSYDANGNRTSSHLHGSDYRTGTNNRLESDGTFDYSYDNEGNLIRRTETTSGSFREFTWDNRNRLRAVVDKDAGETEIQRVEFTYDGLDRRVSKAVNDTVLTHYVYDRDDVLLDFIDSDGTAGPNAPSLAQRYLQGPAVDQVLAQDDGTGNALWHLANHLGTVTDLVDDSGVVVNHITYDSFGNVIGSIGNVIGQSDPNMVTRYTYTGRELDTELDLYYYRARFYDSSFGRFLSLDPLSFAAADANLYRYVGNDPVNMRDPLGLCEVPDDEPPNEDEEDGPPGEPPPLEGGPPGEPPGTTVSQNFGKGAEFIQAFLQALAGIAGRSI